MTYTHIYRIYNIYNIYTLNIIYIYISIFSKVEIEFVFVLLWGNLHLIRLGSQWERETKTTTVDSNRRKMKTNQSTQISSFQSLCPHHGGHGGHDQREGVAQGGGLNRGGALPSRQVKLAKREAKRS